MDFTGPHRAEEYRNGRKLFPMDEVLITAKLGPAPAGRKTYYQPTALESQFPLNGVPYTPRETHNFVDEQSRVRDRRGVTLEFLSPRKAWAPVGGSASRPIPQPPTPAGSADGASLGGSERKKVAGPPSERLMSRPKREELSPKIPLPKKTVDVTKLTERMNNDVQQRSARQKEREKKAAAQLQESPKAKHDADSGVPAAPPLFKDPEEYFKRLVDDPLKKREKQLEDLTKKLVTPNKSDRKLTSADVKEMATRLYNKGVQHQREAINHAAKKYIDDQAPKFPVMSPEELRQMSLRLNRNEARSDGSK